MITSAAGTCSTVTGNVNSAGRDGATTTSCGGNVKYDVWYKFVAQTTNPTISLNVTGANFTNPGIELYQGTCAGTVKGCASGATATIYATGLTVGTTYFIRILSTATSAVPTTNTNFTVCVSDPPANDLCSAPATITPGLTCTTSSGTLYGATYTTIASACGNSSGNRNDVWFKFTAQSESPTITLASAPAGTLYQVYTAASCGGTVSSVYCSTALSATLTNLLTPGSDYLIRVYNNNNTSGTFTVCVKDNPPANDACAGAIDLGTPGANCITTAGSFYGATTTNPTGSCGNYYDVWYKFTVPASASFANINVIPTSSPSSITTSNTFVELFNANACGTSLNNKSLGCSDISSVRGSGLLTAGSTYYFRIYTTVNPSVNPTNWNFNVCVTASDNADAESSRMREVFKQKILSPPNVLNDPWEIIYGPDNYLWITEAKGYKVYRMDPNTGVKTTILDLSPGASGGGLTSGQHTTFNRVDWSAWSTTSWPQGGMAGMAIHPDFANKPFVYVSYVRRYDSTSVKTNGGVFFTNSLVKFTYNSSTNQLESPEMICDTLPGSTDHNSQRMIIAPYNGTYYLFYAQGDMGAGQFGNAQRTNFAQNSASYQGKILRFRLESILAEPVYDRFIPDDNPFNLPGKKSAVWVTGIRNNQGFAFARINGVDYLYGTSHGPFSDDEINIIKPARNYGHPRVIGYASDHNYDKAKAGEPGSALPLIYNEAKYASDTIGASYQDPIFSFYPADSGTTSIPSSIQFIYNNKNYVAPWVTGAALNQNMNWYSEGISGTEIYTNSMIPGWKNSLIIGTLKGGKVERMKLTPDGSGIVAAGTDVEKNDTLGYFRSVNRFRDVAIAPDGKTIFTVIDKSQTTSGPTEMNPFQSACAGCVQKYTFLGYTSGAGNRSNIRTLIPVASGIVNTFEKANSVVINAANGNTNLWVPITDTNSNVVAEINAQGHDLDTVTTWLFTRTGASRIKSGIKYLNRSLTIKPQKQPGGTVWIRLYVKKAEFDSYNTETGNSLTSMKIIKNTDSCTTTIVANTVQANTTIEESFGTDAYVFQADITGFSSFYFAPALITLPVELVNFSGVMQGNTALLQWQTDNENNTSQFEVERSLDGTVYNKVGSVAAAGFSTTRLTYNFPDKDAGIQPANLLYYRLKIVDRDGSYKYSNVITLSLEHVAGKITVSPNPVVTDVNVGVTVNADGRAQWRLIDNSGQSVLRGTLQLRKGNNSTTISMGNLTAGIYYLHVTGDGIDQIVKVQKL